MSLKKIKNKEATTDAPVAKVTKTAEEKAAAVEAKKQAMEKKISEAMTASGITATADQMVTFIDAMTKVVKAAKVAGAGKARGIYKFLNEAPAQVNFSAHEKLVYEVLKDLKEATGEEIFNECINRGLATKSTAKNFVPWHTALMRRLGVIA